MFLVADHEKQLLLNVARRALTQAVDGIKPFEDIPVDEEFPEKFSQPGGAFVTLRLRGRLRGCIGQLVSSMPLIRVVAYCAKAAALEDPRFNAVTSREVTEIDIELSILSPPKDATIEEIEPGRHGLIVSNGSQRGLLLPQVATEFHWSAQRFLEETCIKGGLQANAWRDAATRTQVFTGEVFSESIQRAKEKSA
jgi:AmmeMemoRadiSam system protein A